MRGVDTNVLLRFLTADDPEQSAQAAALIEAEEERGDRLHVNLIVLCELAWSLRGGAYRYTRPAIAGAIDALLEAQIFAVQERDLVRQALADYRKGAGDFADHLIGRLNRAAGCADTVTFDGELRGAESFSVLVAAEHRGA
jgi:predicted nucleic-acid-binding protein